MGHIVTLDAKGHLVYEGLLSSKEIATIDDILNALKQEIPQIEADLEEAYGKSVLYKYNLGKFLGNLLNMKSLLLNGDNFGMKLKPLLQKKYVPEMKELMRKHVVFMGSVIGCLNLIKK